MSNPYWPDPEPGQPAIRLRAMGDEYRFQVYLRQQSRKRAPLGARRPRYRISRHAVDHALHVAAFGSHLCRPFPVPIT